LKAVRGWVDRAVRSRFVRRLSRALLVSLAVVTIAFGLLHAIPGDPARAIAGEEATEERLDLIRKQLGIDGPIVTQYFRYLGGVTRGDLGRSLVSAQPVTNIIAGTMPVTIWLVGITLTLAVLLSIPLAIVAAILRNTRFARILRVVTSVMIAIPVFYTALILILIFAVHLRVGPVGGYEPGFPKNLQYLWLPALTGCFVLVPIVSRILESSITRTLREEFVEAAILRGVPRRRMILHYLLRPSLAPTIGFLGFILGASLGGAAITEIVFNLPGLSSTMVAAVLQRDYPLVMGIALVLGLVVVVISFLADVISEWLDPRVATT
jgi:peptide/nickel transport system permease protein